MDKKFWHTRFIRSALNAADALDLAAKDAVAANDDRLFLIIHEMKLKLLETAASLVLDMSQQPELER